MTDGQLAAMLATLSTLVTALVGVIRWSALRLTKALDDNTQSNKEDAQAKVQLAREMAVLSTKIDSVADFVQEHTPVNQPIPKPPRAQSQPGTTYLHIRKERP